MSYRSRLWKSGLLGTAIAVNLGVCQSVPAVQLADGTVAFVQPPRLVNAVTTSSTINSPVATYYFTFAVPENAGEPVQRVTFTQEQSAAIIRFQTSGTEAFEGERSRPGAALTLSDTTFNPETRTISVTFKSSIPSGKTVTVGLQPVRNPSAKGTYFFGVTAFPAGEKVQGQFLGYGRFQFRGLRGV